MTKTRKFEDALITLCEIAAMNGCNVLPTNRHNVFNVTYDLAIDCPDQPPTMEECEEAVRFCHAECHDDLTAVCFGILVGPFYDGADSFNVTISNR